MPKELVRDMFNGQVFPVLAEGGKTFDPPKMSDPDWRYLKVGWNRGGGGIGLRTFRSDEHATEVGGDPVSEGQSIWLDRNGINDLIRVLRKARDQAFGADA